MSRYETKFVLNQLQMEYLRDHLCHLMPPDNNQQRHGKYPVFSAYYDTKDLDYFYHKIDGEWLHVKIRLRKYAKSLYAPGPCYLEAKIKEGGDQHKVRVQLETHPNIADPAQWLVSEDPKIAFFAQTLAQKPIYPTCNVYYEREAYQFELFNGELLRINFDTNILGLFPFEKEVTPDLVHKRQVLEPQSGILEIKYKTDEFPDFVMALLRKCGAHREPYSKYANVIQALDQIIEKPEISV